MSTINLKTMLRTAVAASMLLAMGMAAAATTTVNLTAQRMTATGLPPDSAMPSGATVPMWGYCITGSCSATWAVGPTITVPYGNTLTINLTNSLPVPTSIVVLGQLGGGLGSPTRMDSPAHAPQTQTTWPANADATFTPPAQLQRAKSFATEVPANSTSAVTLTWNNLKPGTYLYETGTLPSVQAPMGLYGVLIVTQAPIAAGPSNVPPFALGNAYPNKGIVATYDSDVALLFSEIDPVQNTAVDNAAVAGTDVNLRFNDPNCKTLPNDTTPRCYPAAVNYTPKYFLINGKSFDQTNPANSAFAVAGTSLAPGTSSTGNVLVRLLNAGSRTHIPSIVGLPMTIVAEDGNVAPGNFKVQNEVLLTAGKTHDVLVKPAAASGAYVGKAFAVFDRQLSLSAANQLNAGMQGYLQVAGGALPSLPTPSMVTPTAVADMFPVPLGTTINGNVRTNDIAVANAAVVASNDPLKGTLTFYTDGTFVYTPLSTAPTTDTFTYNGNDGTTNTVTVTLNIGTATTGTGAPTAHNQTYTSNVATKFSLSRPGVLVNDTSPGNLALTAALADKGTCNSVSVNASGSFTATGSGSCHFTYKAVNSQNLASAAATVTVNFPAGSHLNVTVTDPADGSSITDYRWIIQEDLTFKVVPTGTPSLATRTLGTSFHKSHMSVVATGCTGPQSCGDDQNVRGSPVTPQARTSPGDVALDSSKNYYISILPGDAGDGGHAMGGTEIRSGWTSAPSVMVSSNAYPFIPAQLSIFIYEDNAPVNGQNDLNENGLGGFNIILVDAVGRSGDPAGQQTYDAMGMPLSNWLLGQPGCPDDLNKRTNGQSLTTTATVRNRNGVIGQINTIAVPSGTSGFSSSPTVTITDPTGTGAIAVANVNSLGRITSFTIVNRGSGYTAPIVTVAQTGLSTTGAVGVIYTCPNDPNEGTAQADPAKYALAGHALIKNVTPARYDVIAHPAAARMAAGEVWWQVETLEGTPAQDAFAGIKEPRYFQEFGPPGFHTTIGFVNPKRVAAYATANGLTGNNTITGKITNQHMSRPSNVTLWDSGSYDLLSSTTCLVALNSQGGDGPAIATAQCDPEGNFTLSKVPAGSYEIAVFDQWLDQIIQAVAVSVPEGGNQTVAMGNIPVLSWFTQYDQNIFMESKTKSANLRGVYRQDLGDTGIANVTQSTRYRDGGMSNQTATDSNGNGLLAELFPLFNWYVTEADTTRFKQTGANIIVDAGGPTDTSGDGTGLWNSVYQATPAHPTGCDPTGGSLPSLGGACDSTNTTNRVEIPGAYSYGLQGFISQRNVINWGRTPYATNENGGIQGLVVNSTTRPFDDQRYNVQTIWEPAVPRVTVNLYSKKIVGGIETLELVDTTTTSSWDDFVNAVDPITGKQVNLQCPGQRPDDPFYHYVLNSNDQFRCYDGWHNWNQVQAAPYDGRYQFPSPAYIAAHQSDLGTCANMLPNGQRDPANCKTLVSLPPGQYVVEAVTPPGYEIVKEEDKNILNGDAFVAQVPQQFGGIINVFILPDQATLNNANPFNQNQNNATTNLGVSASQLQFTECVGDMHRVPDYLSLFPGGGLVAPFAGMDRPLCDRKLVNLIDQQQASATFFVFTYVPAAAAGAGIILDDATSEFNAAAPDFGEKASVPFVPISIKDFNGREIGRSYSDQWGAYNVLTPSSWLVNPPTPSGYGPNMLITCMNDPGPIADPAGTIDPATNKVRMITDPQYNAAYSNFCYTLPFMPGRTTYLDTPVLPVAAFASGYNPPDCAYPDATPAIARVDSNAGFGPYLPASGTLTITSQGQQNVLNPAYAGPFADTGPASQRIISRNYGFGASKGTVKIGNVTIPPGNISWSDSTITITGVTASGELVVTNANGKSTVDAVTVTVGGTAPKRVPSTQFPTIQAAIDAATPGDLILVDAGTYNELVIMWKPVRLQGVGAASVIINAAKYPNSKLGTWRPTINALFGIDTNTGNQSTTGTQVDPLPGQEVTGGVVLLEPSVLGTEEGAGITVLAKGFRADGVTPLTNRTADCSYGSDPTVTFDLDNGANTTPKPGLSNFLCASSRIDGISVTGGDAGGGIYVNGWAHNLEIANNRVYGNAGALNGGVRVGVPYLEQANFPGVTENPDGTVSGTPTLSGGVIAGFGYDNNVKIHHNAITRNGTVEGPAGNGGAGGGVSICTGTDGYSVDHNWICGNFSSSDGGGLGHIGFSQNGSITNNTIEFNQSFQQTMSTHGGGIMVVGEPNVGGTLTLGTGNLTIDSNLIRGNFAEGGHGGGIRVQQANGADVEAFSQTSRWHKVTMINNMIVDNIAGWAGGGISLADTVNSVIVNNTVASNDSASIAGVLLTGNAAVQLPAEGLVGTTGKSHPNPAGISSDPTSTDLRNARSGVSVISTPVLTNNILWHNRSFYYDGTGTSGATLCANNGTDSTCHHLVDQTTTGACDTTNARYWDLGVLGEASATSVISAQPDPYAVASATQATAGNVRTVTAVLAVDSTLGNGQQVTMAGFLPGTSGMTQAQINARYSGVFTITLIDADTFSYTANNGPTIAISTLSKASGVVTVTTTAAHNLVTGNSVTITVSNANNAAYGGTFTITVIDATHFRYTKGTGNAATVTSGTRTALLVLTDAQFALLDMSNVTATPVAVAIPAGNRLSPTYSVLTSLTGYAGTGNSAADPNLADLYCNGSRVTPEFPGVINPPSVKNLQVAATTDEGNNYVNLRYGPLYVAKPTTPAGTAYVAFGDYHLAAASGSAYNAGTSSGAPNHDFDGDSRPQAGAFDIGADEFVGVQAAVASITGGPLSFGNVANGATSAAQTLTLHNTGNANLTSIALAFSSPRYSRLGGTCGTTLTPVGGTCTITVVFSPTAIGLVNATLTVTANVAVTGSPVSLSGTGVAPVVSATLAPASWTVAQTRNCPGTGIGQLACAFDPSQAFTLTNTGNTPLTGIGQGVLGGTAANVANYAIVGALSTCGSSVTTLAPGATCVVRVQFKPLTSQVTGLKPATVSVTDAAGTQTSTLNGTAN